MIFDGGGIITDGMRLQNCRIIDCGYCVGFVGGCLRGVEVEYCVYNCCWSCFLGTFDDNRFQSEAKTPVLKSVDIVGLGTGPDIKKKLKYAEDVCTRIVLEGS